MSAEPRFDKDRRCDECGATMDDDTDGFVCEDCLAEQESDDD